MEEYAKHLINAPQEKYEVTQYCTGGLYSVITLKLEYKAHLLKNIHTRIRQIYPTKVTAPSSSPATALTPFV